MYVCMYGWMNVAGDRGVRVTYMVSNSLVSNFETFQRFHHVNDAGSSPFARTYLQATPRQKYIYVKFLMNCRANRWPRGSGDVLWPQNLGSPRASGAGKETTTTTKTQIRLLLITEKLVS